MADKEDKVLPFIAVCVKSVKSIKSKMDDNQLSAPKNQLPASKDQLQTSPILTVDTQTDYRDSETQTEPYTPKFVARPGTPPELLTLAELTMGHGLPAGLLEMERLELRRRRKAKEAMMPPFDDLAQLAKRERIMKEIEREKWIYREKEIQRQHDVCLDQLTQQLCQREEKQQQITNKRLEKHFYKRQSNKEAKMHKLQMDYFASIRRLTETERNVGGVLETRKIIKAYSEYTKRVFAPRPYNSPEMDSLLDTVKSKYLSTYEGLLELEAEIPDSFTDLSIDEPKPKTFKGFIKRTDRQEMKLMRIHQALKVDKEKLEDKPYRFLHRLKKPRFSSLVAGQLPWDDEDDDLPVVFLKKVLKGTSVMVLVFEGKEKRLELIQELRATHALQQEERELQEADKQATLTLQRQRELHNHKESMAMGYQRGIVGKVVADTLFLLSK